MALANRVPRKLPKGQAKPRFAPPTPARTRLADFEAAAKDLSLELMPWQKFAARYLMALGKDTDPLYREVCIVVARRNGKTTLLLPLILLALRAGHEIIHAAQDRALPGLTFEALANAVDGWPEVASIRRANGQEAIRFKNGGRYVLVAPNHGVRGRNAHLVILDEVREQHDDNLMNAILPTVATNPKAQVVYLSNAGDEQSVVLNRLRSRKDDPGRLAYLEWSAPAELDVDDPAAWGYANPALGYTLSYDSLRDLRQALDGPAFETEHLCRWVVSLRARLVEENAWLAGSVPDLGTPRQPYLGIAMDPDGKRASAALAWRMSNDTIALRLLLDGRGDPIEVADLGKDLRKFAMENRVLNTGYNPMTDHALLRYLPKSQKITGQAFADASSQFALVVQSGKLRYDAAEAVTDDLAWTTRKVHDVSGKYEAVRADDERPITAALAAIRAVWLASGNVASVGRPMIG